MKIMIDNKKLIFILTFTFFCTYISVFEYAKSINQIIGQLENWHNTHMLGNAQAPLQYRIISFLFPEILFKITSIKISYLYIFERFIFIWMSLIIFYFILKEWFTTTESLLQVLFFTHIYTLTIFPHFQPSEEINIFIFALAIFFMIKEKYELLLLIAFIGAFNKDTIVFIIPIYFLNNYFKNMNIRSNGIKTLILSVAIFFAYFSLRFYYGVDRDYLGGLWQYSYNLHMMKDVNLLSYNFLIPTFIPFIFVLLKWQKQPEIIKAGVITLVPFFLGHFMISRLEEFRTFMPLALLTVPGLFIYLKSKNLLLDKIS